MSTQAGDVHPSKDGELELDQIDYLKSRYPNHVIGLSTHERTTGNPPC